MKFKPGQLWLLKLSQPPAETKNPLIAEVTKTDDVFVYYNLNGTPAKVLTKHFDEMADRLWAPPKKRMGKREVLPKEM